MPRSSSRSRPEAATFWLLAAGVVVLDAITKYVAVTLLPPQRIPREIVGEFVRLTLVYNPGAAFGLFLGQWSRQIFLVLTIFALFVLVRLYRTTRPGDRLRIIALGLVCGGAVGNLIDRIRSPIGVVDFLDLGFRDYRWPTFNVADIAVSTGAVLLAWALWSEDRRREPAVPESALPEAKVSRGG